MTGDGAWQFDAALTTARAADVAVVFVGGSSKGTIEGVTYLVRLRSLSLCACPCIYVCVRIYLRTYVWVRVCADDCVHVCGHVCVVCV